MLRDTEMLTRGIAAHWGGNGSPLRRCRSPPGFSRNSRDAAVESQYCIQVEDGEIEDLPDNEVPDEISD